MSRSSDRKIIAKSHRTALRSPDLTGLGVGSVRCSAPSTGKESTTEHRTESGELTGLDSRILRRIRSPVLGPVRSDPVQTYFDEIQPAVLVSLELALRSDPSADVIVLASRVGDETEVCTVPRTLALAHFQSSPHLQLRNICERIEKPPTLPTARWLVCVTPSFISTSALLAVRHDTGASA
jgi:hypothetical protein